MSKPMTKKGYKKKAWDEFSKYIRLRDCLKTTGTKEWALCITCNKRYHFKVLQAGHFIPGRHNQNLFDETGCHAQCYHCNIHLRGNTLEYRRKIIEMYGEGYDEELERRDKITKKFTIYDLQELRDKFKQKIKELNQREN